MGRETNSKPMKSRGESDDSPTTKVGSGQVEERAGEVVKGELQSLDESPRYERHLADVLMPQIRTAVEGTLVQGLKRAGESVKPREPLFDMTSGGIYARIASPYTGVLHEIKVSARETVAVNTIVARIERRLKLNQIRAPFPGIFLRIPAGYCKPFVEIGDRVEPCSVVGLIEAQGLAYEIPAGISGVGWGELAYIYVTDAQVVELDQPLFGLLCEELSVVEQRVRNLDRWKGKDEEKEQHDRKMRQLLQMRAKERQKRHR